MNSQGRKIWLVTGERGVGKTRFSTRLVDKARQLNLDVAGVLSSPVFSGNTKTGIQIENLRTGEHRLLALQRVEDSKATSTRRWTFDDEVLKWGNTILAECLPCQLLVVDELGTLEFERGMGLLNGITALKSGRFMSAVVVIRPELLELAKLRFETTNVVDIPSDLNEVLENDLITNILSNFKH